MNTLQFEDHQIEPLQQKILLDWLSTAFQSLENEGLSLVDGYWRDLKLEGKNQPYYPKVTLGLRIRRRQGGSFGLEWFGIGTLGTKRRYIAKRYIPKGKAETYPIKRLMRGQPHWLMPLVEDTEYHLAKIRNLNPIITLTKAASCGIRLRLPLGP